MSLCKKPETLAKFNFINHFTAGHIGINSKLSGIAGEEYINTYHFPATMLPHRANPKTQQCPVYAGSKPRLTSTAHLTIMTGLTEYLRVD